jgi:hypothetical protein
MTGILKVDNIQNSSGTSAMSIDGNGEITFNNTSVQSGIGVAIFRRTTNNVQGSGAFRDRNFNALVSNNITGVSLNGSGEAVIPAGTYLIQYNTTIIYDSTAPGETLSRLYDKLNSTVIPNSYSIRGTQAADGTDSVFHNGTLFATWTSTRNLVLQTLTENSNFQDVNTFDGSPGNALATVENHISTQLLVMKLG